jgi:hypothetical protein
METEKNLILIHCDFAVDETIEKKVNRILFWGSSSILRVD